MTETLLLDRARHRLFHDRRLFDPAEGAGAKPLR